jgi:deazaflavin-dependent oxidoreductase (nitroreductase family)
MPNVRWLLALITRLHRFVYLKSGGRIGHRLGGQSMLLLHTIGRKSGQRRITPLLYVPDGDRFLLVASNAGDDRRPAWWLNLRHAGRAEIQVGRERIAVAAHEAGPAERPVLWQRACAQYPNYALYEQRTRRPIPVVVLAREAA